MKVTVNDLAFEFPLYEKKNTMKAVKKFVSICRNLESIRCHNVERIVSSGINMDKELYPTGTLYQIIREIQDKNERTYFLGLLVNRESKAASAEKSFVYKDLESFACAAAKDECLVSMETSGDFKQSEISGTIDGKTVRIRNISCEDHLYYFRNMLGMRIYKANDKKHKKDGDNAYGKGRIGSPMDLCDDEAQELLDCAIWIKQRLYARKGKHNYAFQNEQDCIYHCYIADDLGDDILKELYKKKWD